MNNLPFTEEDVINLTKKVLDKTINNIKDALTNDFYTETKNYLYEHYENFSHDIRKTLINEISDAFIDDPKDYKYSKLRDVLFEENQDLLKEVLTEDYIQSKVDSHLIGLVGQNNYWTNKYITTFINNNFDSVKNHPSFDEAVKNKINRLENELTYLKEQIND